MPRRREVKKREIVSDLKYRELLVAKFINLRMRRGKKNTAEQIFYGSLEILKEKAKDEPLKLFKQAMENVKPVVEVKSRRVGGATYQVPVEVRTDRRLALAMRWIVGYSRKRPEKTMQEKRDGESL